MQWLRSHVPNQGAGLGVDLGVDRHGDTEAGALDIDHVLADGTVANRSAAPSPFLALVHAHAHGPIRACAADGLMATHAVKTVVPGHGPPIHAVLTGWQVTKKKSRTSSFAQLLLK